MNKIWLCALFGLVLFIPYSAKANFEFSPIVADLTTKGKGSVLLARVKSHNSIDIPVVVRILERSMTPSGEEVRVATSDLEVFPTQFILPANAQKFVKVIWRGPENVTHEKSYRLLVEHLPIDLAASKKGAASISIMTNYSGMIYVNSKPSAPRVSVASVTQGENDRSLTIELINDGDKHSIIAKPELEVACKGSSIPPLPLKGAALKNLDSRNMLARSKLITSITTPTGLPKCKEYSWSFRYLVR